MKNPVISEELKEGILKYVGESTCFEPDCWEVINYENASYCVKQSTHEVVPLQIEPTSENLGILVNIVKDMGNEYDIEKYHVTTDALMEAILEDLGYGALVSEICKHGRYYA